MAISKFNYNSFNVTPVAGNALSFNSDADGFTTQSSSSMILIKTLTASSSATLSFLNGSDGVVLDDTYPVYQFEFINIHPANNDVTFRFQGDTGTNTSYNQTITNTFFGASHKEDNSAASLAYQTGSDQAQGTGFARLSAGIKNDNDASFNGILTIFSPSSGTFVKHFISRGTSYESGDQPFDDFSAGYFNTTTALTRFQFKMSGGNIDSGKIKLYGIADS